MGYAERKRLRYGLGIGLEEYSSRNIGMVRDFQAELLNSRGYIGYFDSWGTLRVFVFENAQSRNRALREAKDIGFSSAGTIVGELFIGNSEMKRPHLQLAGRKDTFYREYYR